MKKIKNYVVLFFMLSVNTVYAAESIDDLHFCENPDVLTVMSTILTVLGIIKLMIPVILIILGSIDIAKAVISNDNDAIKKGFNTFIKRVILGIVIFFIPTIVKMVMISLGNLAAGINYTDCLENANKAGITRSQEKYDALLEKQKAEAKQKETEVDFGNIDPGDASKKSQIDKKNTDSADSGTGNSSSSSTSTSIANVPSSVIENLAAFAGSEVGYGSDRYWGGYLVQIASFMNNYGNSVGQLGSYGKGFSINTPLTMDSICKVFKAGPLYASFYCNLTFDGLPNLNVNYRIPTQHERELMLKAVEIVISKEFTIPSNVWAARGKDNYDSIANVFYKSSSDQWFGTDPDLYFTSVDAYGNTVSTDPNWYKQRIDELYNKYFK